MPKVKPAPVVAAIPDDPVAILAAARDHLAAKSQTVTECEVERTASERVVAAMQDQAAALAKRIGAGEAVDQAELDGSNLKRALAAAEFAIRDGALDEARRQAAAAALEVKKALLAVLDRRAKRSRRPEGETLVALADATAAYVQAVEAARGAHLTRIEADGEAEALRAELQGREPNRAYRHDDAGELRRFLAGLPMAFVMTLHIEWPVADVDLRKMGADYIARAASN